MKPLLVVLHPRMDPRALAAFDSLNIAKAWISFYSECEAVGGQLPLVIEKAKEKGFTHLLLTSDDTVPTQEALDQVLASAKRLTAVSGWVNLDSRRVHSNVSFITLDWKKQPSSPGEYYFLTEDEVRAKSALFPATFSGFAFLCLPIEVWEQIGIQNCHWNSCTDFYVYTRLAELGVQLWVEPQAFFFHLKERDDSAYTAHWGVGNMERQIIWEGAHNG